MEQWKSIEGYTNYEISNLGRLRSTSKVTKKIKIIQPWEHRGYHRYELYKDGKGRKFSSHRLVAETFLQNPENLPQVHHKNSIRGDNSVDNLEWITNKDNCIKKKDSGINASYSKKKLRSYLQSLLDKKLITNLDDLMNYLI